MFKKSKKITIGDKVLVALNGAIRELEIVDIPQADPGQGKISLLAPLARAILGYSYPDRVIVRLPNGKTLECELLRPAI